MVVGSPSPESVGDAAAADVVLAVANESVALVWSGGTDWVAEMSELAAESVTATDEARVASALGKSVVKPPIGPEKVGDSVTNTMVTADG